MPARLLASLGLLGALSLPSLGLARGGCLVVFGYGETVSHIADADLSGDPELEAELSLAEPGIGFRYEYFSILFLDFWTGNGAVVLYDQADDSYYPLSPEQLRALTGRGPDELSAPLLYTTPLGWIVLGALGVVLALRTWLDFRQVP